ncbi:esterase-like activity of phytase family protein [Corallococcus sp. M34]|uniref:esterase-like activity of phytase family protein n=1 Tax=Citreicoccus inhibens TaxID=2849499 RepID=UPI001C24A2E1|nr:esterase-like activity of phytase family protein [Citreicoccus inhibens]MBU8896427.1 esterase-like activity of phytase family protein [Citreicoccus inhibens]
MPVSSRRRLPRTPLLTSVVALSLATACARGRPAPAERAPEPKLVGRAVLEAATWAPGPTSGRYIGPSPQNGIPVPFMERQPVQGFSAVLDNGDGSFLAMPDNGYGSLENSADFNLRVYTLRPDFQTQEGGTGKLAVEGFIELSDPNHHAGFALTNFFTPERVLTGADFDIESMQRAPDGTLWFGDEFGPFLLHTDAQGHLLEAPIPLPDFQNGGELRTPQNPRVEEASAVRVMNAVRAHAFAHGARRAPVFSPDWHLLDDGDRATGTPDRMAPPAGSGLSAASSDLFDVKKLQQAGYAVVPWTVNTPEAMTALLRRGVDGLISDRPDLLWQAVREYDANQDGVPGDLLTPEGLLDASRFDAQGHRGARGLRPENTLPAMEAALDHLMTTLELDTGITSDGVPVLEHDPFLSAEKCRRASGPPYTPGTQVLIRSLTVAKLQATFICDKLLPSQPSQTNERKLSPVAVAFAKRHGLRDAYVPPTLRQVFALVDFYADYYRAGAGAAHPDAMKRARNAERVRFNIETKLNPRQEFAARTVGPEPFADAVAGAILDAGLAARADVQSFDFRTLLRVHERFPSVRTVCLVGDFPVYASPTVAGSDEGDNLQPEGSGTTPWLGGLPWPYRVTAKDHPFRVRASGGFEAMALSRDGATLLPLLEKPLADDTTGTLLIHEFDLAHRRYTGVTHRYALATRGTSATDFVLFDRDRGVVLERDNTQGDLAGYKALYEVRLTGDGQPVKKRLAVDLLNIANPFHLTHPEVGDLGLGDRFAFPFITTEAVLVFDPRHVGLLNDNNFPFSVGRHLGSGRPDDSEFVRLELGEPLGGL